MSWYETGQKIIPAELSLLNSGVLSCSIFLNVLCALVHCLHELGNIVTFN